MKKRMKGSYIKDQRVMIAANHVRAISPSSRTGRAHSYPWLVDDAPPMGVPRRGLDFADAPEVYGEREEVLRCAC